MTQPSLSNRQILPIVALVMLSQGCAHRLACRPGHDAIPARHLPDCLSAVSREALVPIDLRLLSYPSPEQYVVDAGDVLGIYVQDVLDESNRLPQVHFVADEEATIVETPSVGHPVRVQHDGTISLPQIEPIGVSGLTFAEIVDAIRQSYIEHSILNPGSDRISVGLIKPRTYQVTVIREDIGQPVSLINRDSQVLSKRGQGELLELPVYENHLLQAITLTGGLPGTDAEGEIWILPGDSSPWLLERLGAGANLEELIQDQNGIPGVTRVPLRTLPGAPLPFTSEDVVLEDGDIVFIDSRKNEYFFAGGLLNGGKIPLPRDEDVDILEAIAIANGNLNGPAATQGVTINNRGPGNIIPPTRAFIVRKLDDGTQIKIEADLEVALSDPRERVLVQPGDFVLLKYKPHEILSNVALNLVNLTYIIPND